MTDEHQALQFTITSPGWLLYLQAGGKRQKEYMAKLLDTQNIEMSVAETNYYRGYINALIWSGTWPRQEVDTAVELERDEQRMVEESGVDAEDHRLQRAGIDYPQED